MIMDSAGKPKRYVINKDASGHPVSGHCSKCGRIFQFENTTGVRHMEKAFETHECPRDVQGITNHYQKFWRQSQHGDRRHGENPETRGATGGIGKGDSAQADKA